MDKKKRAEQIVSLYNSGESPTKLAQRFKVERKSIYRILDRNKVSLRPPEKKNCCICFKIILVEKNKNRTRCNTCNTNIRRYRAKKKAVEYKGGKCVKCGWTGNICSFDFHHLDPVKKDFTIGNRFAAGMSWDKVKKELDKCELLCAICHRIEHSNYNDPIFLSEAEKTE